MRARMGILAGLMLLAPPAAAFDDDADEAERAAMKRVLDETIKMLEPRVKDNEKAVAELKKLRDTKGEDLDRMAREFRKQFKIDSKVKDTDPQRCKNHVKREIGKARDDDLKKLLENRDGAVIPQLCWLFGCP